MFAPAQTQLNERFKYDWRMSLGITIPLGPSQGKTGRSWHVRLGQHETAEETQHHPVHFLTHIMTKIISRN